MRTERSVTLQAAGPPLVLALRRMLEGAGFVIVEHTKTDRFVQFTGECPASAGEPILLDVPALGLTEPFGTPEAAAERAIAVLVWYGIALGDALTIIEEDDKSDGRGLFEWARAGLFGGRPPPAEA